MHGDNDADEPAREGRDAIKVEKGRAFGGLVFFVLFAPALFLFAFFALYAVALCQAREFNDFFFVVFWALPVAFTIYAHGIEYKLRRNRRKKKAPPVFIQEALIRIILIGVVVCVFVKSFTFRVDNRYRRSSRGRICMLLARRLLAS